MLKVLMKQKYKFLFKRLFYYIYGEKFYKRLNYNWEGLPSRTEIIQNIITKNKYKKYLEIGCDNDENFSKIKIENEEVVILEKNDETEPADEVNNARKKRRRSSASID